MGVGWASPALPAATWLADKVFSNQFGAPQVVQYTVITSGIDSGAIWGSFSLPWPGGNTILIVYGGEIVVAAHVCAL